MIYVAFQGEPGAFSEEAAISLLGSQTQLLPCNSFESMFDEGHQGKADMILAPLENSLIGSISRCYDLLLESSLQIIAEVVHPIHHCLIGCQESSFEDIKTVESHPAALAQCEKFFAANPKIKAIATNDTAASVRRVIERSDPTVAAIASYRACLIYKGKLLGQNLEDNSQNYTRFGLLTSKDKASKKSTKFSIPNKLSLAFYPSKADNELCRLLQYFTDHNIELLKIETRPIKGRPWNYSFCLDLRACLEKEQLKNILEDLQNQGYKLQFLGFYPEMLMPKQN